jgi:hypothetical protein
MRGLRAGDQVPVLVVSSKSFDEIPLLSRLAEMTECADANAAEQHVRSLILAHPLPMAASGWCPLGAICAMERPHLPSELREHIDRRLELIRIISPAASVDFGRAAPAVLFQAMERALPAATPGPVVYLPIRLAQDMHSVMTVLTASPSSSMPSSDFLADQVRSAKTLIHLAAKHQSAGKT